VPEVATQDAELGRVIAWADANPKAWKIVTANKSKAFGARSCNYIGWAQGSPAPAAVLERLRHFCAVVRPDITEDFLASAGPTIFRWKGLFTFAHYGDKGFTGGFFQQHDGQYDRNCMSLDHTPATLPQVLRNFMEWSGKHAGDRWKLDREFIDEGTVRRALSLAPDWNW
jgi:hypothetical protein